MAGENTGSLITELLRPPQVRGVLNKEEVIMSKAKSSYLAKVHVLVGTPGALAEVAAGDCICWS